MCGPALRSSLLWPVASLACLPSAPSAGLSSALPLPLSLYLLGYGVCGAGCWRGCVPVLVLVWTWVAWGMVDGWPLRSAFPVCVSSLGHPVAFGFRRTGQGSAGVWRSAAVVVWCLCGWSWLLGSAWVVWCSWHGPFG